MFNAFLFSFFYSLFSKSEYRSSQIIFTNKLLINVDMKSDKAYARLQCYDIGEWCTVLIKWNTVWYILSRVFVFVVEQFDRDRDTRR